MNRLNHQEMVQEATQEKFCGRQTLNSRTTPRYPITPEREYARINRLYMQLLKESLQNHLPEIIAAYKEERLDARFDEGFKLFDKIRKIMQKIAEEIEQKIGRFGLDRQIEKIANLTSAVSFEEWRRSVKQTLGIDLFADYYKGDIYSQSVQQWIANNVRQIKSLPSNTLGKLEQIIADGYRQGKSIAQLKNEIQTTYSVEKKKAEFLARDQVSSLNAEITKMQQTDAGVKRYRWSSVKDSRVRDCHRALDGKVFSWNDPPEMWYKTKKGIVHTGRHCHPGEDYACRCVAIPIFDWQTVDLPMDSDKK